MIHIVTVVATLATLATISMATVCIERAPSNNETTCRGEPCIHGNCTRLTLPGFVYERCECDPNWHGQHCDECCDLHCLNGNCHFQDGRPFCSCFNDWMGDLCDVHESQRWQECNAASRSSSVECEDKTCYHGNCTVHMIDTQFGQIPRGVCVCDPGWKGMECDECCDLYCGDHGNCDFHHDDEEQPFCNCDAGFTGTNCSVCHEGYTGDNCSVIVLPSFLGEPQVWPEYVIGVTVALCVVIIILAIILPYCLYKKRVLIITKIVYKLKTFEEDPKRPYDAFISYRTSSEEDRHFVTTKLFPKLEKDLGFKLCIDQKDFIPGAAIVDNILTALSKSKRTILIISPEFCQSEWTQFEYHRAITESMYSKHRIIPVIYQDISEVEKLDKTLKHILQSITYIEYPGVDAPKLEENFWEKIRLAMPKLKPMQDNNGRKTARGGKGACCWIPKDRKDAKMHPDFTVDL